MTAKSLFVALLALPLAGCLSFGAKPPKQLLTLAPASAVPVGQVQSSAGGRAVSIDVPAVPAALAGARIPVQTGPTAIAYLKDAAWSEPPARLFARLLADTVQTRSGLVVLSSVQAQGNPSSQLTGELRNFGVDSATREAVVTFDGSLHREGSDVIEKRRFETRVPVSAIDAASVGAPLNQAANTVATDVAGWLARR